IVHQQAEGCVLETLLVLDSTTGQNAVNQAKLFSEVAEITGIVLTKLDGTAKGGIIISIHRELGIPVKLVGVGEKLDDLQDFCAKDFADALFETETDFDYNYERLDDKKEEKEDEKDDESVLEKAEDFFEDIGDKIEDTADKVEDKFEEIGDKIEDKFEDIVDDIKDKLDGDDESEEGKEETADEAEKPAEKKDLKNGKFGFLFKEISFGKKKKNEENNDTEE
ncbi:MAG: hypothetical protein J6A05_00790, partial [Oscillospiraceae bacterium]|nr:hypothetical protein [Oscillospiraceae bacterium]